MADDLGYGDIGVYGQELMDTPNLDELAGEGIRFVQAYAGGPVCTPSRSVLMTGLHNGHTPARDNIPHYHTYLRRGDTTLAEVLSDAGYRTGGVGKWSLGDAGTVGRATNQGFDMWLGYLNQDHAHYYYPRYLDYNDGRLNLEGNPVLREHYSHNILVRKAIQFIRSSQNQPFFLYAAFTLPHFSARSEDRDRFAVPSTDPYSKKDWSSQSKKYAAMVDMLDEDVGRIVDLVDDLGLSEETLVIFTSDNGGHSILSDSIDTNGPLRGYKRDLTEGGIRVPFIARWTGQIPSGETSEEVIAFQDMMPTFAELAGADPPAETDGVSIVEALDGKELTNPHEYLYWDYGHTRERYDQAVRMSKWKGIRLGEGNDIQLYNLHNDIEEAHDVSAEHPDVVEEIDRIMEEAFEPSDRYPIGEVYTGDPIWKRR